MKHKTTFAKNLKFLRRLKGLTQNQLAENLRIKRNKISSYESGFAQPNLETLIQIAHFFEVQIGKLVTVALDPEASNIKTVKGLPSHISESIKVDISNFIQSTNEVQKIYDGFLALKDLDPLDPGQSSEVRSFEEEELLKIMNYLLSNNWSLINSFQN